MAVWEDKFIKVNKYARSGKKLKSVRKIVMHYTANPGGTAENHYRYFNNLENNYASAHFFIDKDEALCIIPLNEMAYHANDTQRRNEDGSSWRGVKELLPNANELSIGIEMCIERDYSLHPDMIKRTIEVVAELCKRYKLDPLKDIVRHRDVTYKNCPALWVKNPTQFEDFKKDVNELVNPSKPIDEQVYRVRKSWEDVASQIGAFKELDSAKELADSNAKDGFEVYNKDGKVVHKPVVSQPKPPVKQPAKPKPPAKPKNTLTYKRTLKVGMEGADVKALQEALNKLNFKCGTPDGEFGQKTKDAVERFQKVHMALEVDGIAGKKTIAKINSLLK